MDAGATLHFLVGSDIVPVSLVILGVVACKKILRFLSSQDNFPKETPLNREKKRPSEDDGTGDLVRAEPEYIVRDGDNRQRVPADELEPERQGLGAEERPNENERPMQDNSQIDINDQNLFDVQNAGILQSTSSKNVVTVQHIDLTPRAFEGSVDGADPNEKSVTLAVAPVGDDGVDYGDESDDGERSNIQTGPSTTQEVVIKPVIFSPIIVGPSKEIPNPHTASATDPFQFSITDKGCFVTSPYCNFHCPPGAVERSIDVTMSPEYYPQEDFGNDGIFVTPYVNFSSPDNLVFDKDVTLSIYSSYSAADKDNPIPVKIMRKTRDGIQEITQVLMEQEEYITFNCRRFCGLAAHITRDQLTKTRRRYYSAAYVRESGLKQEGVLHWLIYDDMPVVREENVKYMQNREVAIDPESVTLRYPEKLQIKITKGQCTGIEPEQLTLALADFYGMKIDEKYQFGLNWGVAANARRLQLRYQMVAISNEASATLKNKQFFVICNQEGSREQHGNNGENAPVANPIPTSLVSSDGSDRSSVHRRNVGGPVPQPRKKRATDNLSTQQ